MRERVLLDTGPLVAWLDADDQWHDVATGFTRLLEPPFVCCEPVIAETCFILRTAPGALVQLAHWFDDGFIRVEFSLQDEAAAVFRLMEKYRDLPMSLADACLVRMVETDIGDRILTLDWHFQVYRQSGRRRVPVLMPEGE